MEPQIRYCTTANGISIAYWTMGQGTPLVITPPFGFSHIQLELEDAELRAWYERLARNHTVVRFDLLSNGLSQRGLTAGDWKSTPVCADYDAVVDALALDSFDMIACGGTGWSGCTYASRNPARVARLVLWAVPPEGGDWGSGEARAALGTAELDFRTFTETFANAVLGWAAPDRARQWARFMRRSMDEADFRLVAEIGPPNVDRSAVLSSIQARTLVMYPRRGGRVITSAAAQQVAASVAGAQLAFVTTDPASLAPSSEEALSVTEDFLFDGSPPATTSHATTSQQVTETRVASRSPSVQTAPHDMSRSAPLAEPRVQYAKTADGVNVAYWRMGAGPPVIDMGQPPATHIDMECRLAPLAAWYERFIRHHAFVRLDTRGFGLSDRDVNAYSIDTMVADLEAVADAAVPAAPFALVGAINTSAAAIAYAAKHPARVERLILWCPYVIGTDFFDIPGTPGLRRMLDEDWHMFTETASRSRFTWQADEHAREFASLWRAAATPKVMAILMDSLRTVDVTSLLSEVRAPTLVIQRIDRGEAVARRITDGIPDAELVLLPGGSAAPYLDDADEVWRVIAQFLGDPTDATRQSSATDTAIILFADIVDSTRITERIGDDAFRDRARSLDERLRTIIRAADGTPVEGKLLGDGVLAVFSSARHSIEAALRCATAGASFDLQLHIGIHAGDVIREGDNVFGGAVNIASRISGLSAPDEVLVSATVRDLARTSAGVTFEDRGEHMLKGIDEPQRVYAAIARSQ